MTHSEEATADRDGKPIAGQRAARRQDPLAAYLLFFFGAATFAVLSPPLWIAGYLGVLTSGAPIDAAHHAHEMLLGFAAAVLSGFLITKGSRPVILTAFAAWALARLASFGLLPQPELLGTVFGLGFIALFFWLAGVPFIRAARTGHNLVFAPVLAVLVASELAFEISGLWSFREGQHRAMLVAVDAVAAMLFTMGGRIIAGLAAGQLRRLGVKVVHRAHVPLEWIGVSGFAVAALADALGSGRAAQFALALAGCCVVARLSLWHFWRLAKPRDLGLLMLGYLWLGAALLLPATGVIPRVDALHALTIGALGTLTQTMMIRTILLRRRLPDEFPRFAQLGVLLVSLAAFLRLAVPMVGNPAAVAAAGLWSAAFLASLGAMVRMVRKPATGRPVRVGH